MEKRAWIDGMASIESYIFLSFNTFDAEEGEKSWEKSWLWLLLLRIIASHEIEWRLFVLEFGKENKNANWTIRLRKVNPHPSWNAFYTYCLSRGESFYCLI